MADNKFERCAEDALDRCQASGREGQCPFQAVTNGTRCPRHGGIQQQQVVERDGLRNYRLTKYRAKVGEKANSPDLRNLADEIGIIRVMIEEVIEMIDGPNKLLMYTDKISNLVGQVQRLVETSQKLDEKNGELLAKNTLYMIADAVVLLLGEYVKDPDHLIEIGEKILHVIQNVGGIRGTDSIRSFA